MVGGGPLRASLWVLEKSYGHQMMTQIYPKVDRRFSHFQMPLNSCKQHFRVFGRAHGPC